MRRSYPCCSPFAGLLPARRSTAEGVDADPELALHIKWQIDQFHLEASTAEKVFDHHIVMRFGTGYGSLLPLQIYRRQPNTSPPRAHRNFLARVSSAA